MIQYLNDLINSVYEVKQQVKFKKYNLKNN